jgi:hypothetical protein
MCFAGERRSDRTSTIRIVFYLFGGLQATLLARGLAKSSQRSRRSRGRSVKLAKIDLMIGPGAFAVADVCHQKSVGKPLGERREQQRRSF